MTAPDVVVVGAGIVGAAVASELSARDVRVLLVDSGEVSGGTTGLGEGNVLCSDKDAGPELALTVAGMPLWDELEDRLGEVARIRRKGALIVHPTEDTWSGEAARVARLAACGVPGELLGPDEAAAREPWLTGSLLGASYFPGDLQCAPRDIARALAAEVEVRVGCAVEGVVVRSGRVAGVATAEGEIAAGAVVLCAGTWTGPLASSAGLALPVEPRKGQLVRLRVPEPSPRAILHKVVDGSYLRSVMSGGAGLQVTTVLETTWDGHVLVGSSRERRGFDVSVDPAVTEAMLARARRLMPRLEGLEVDSAWAGLRPWLPDHLPAIGPSAAAEGLWLATGHEGAGVALGPVTGRVIAQAMCGEPTLVDLAPFSPDRFAA